MRTRAALTLSMLAIALSPSFAAAQQTDQRQTDRRQPGQQEQAVAQLDNQALPRLLATELALANHCEIELAKMASERSQNQQVKQYAQKLLQDHQQLNAELVRLFPEIGQIQGISVETRAGQGNARTDDATNSQKTNAQTASNRQNPPARGNAAQGGNLTETMKQICVDAANNKLEMTKDMLSQYQGENFDMAFIGQQLAAHMNLLAKLQAVNQSKVETENLKPVLEQAEQTTSQHLEAAKQLCKQLEGTR